MPTLDLNEPFDIKPPSKRTVTKATIHFALKYKVNKVTKQAMIDYLGFEEDGMTVKTSGFLVAELVTRKTKPYTDKVVDKTADWYIARKKRKNEKSQKDQQDKNTSEQ